MRLIDADMLLYDDVDCIDGNTYMIVHASDIDRAKTAYDVDKVIKELNRNSDITNWGKPYGITLEKAIEIVKSGGVANS